MTDREDERPKSKDVYDKISAVAPLLGGSVVALFIGLATLYFNAKQAERQSRFQEIDAIAKMMPYLTSDKPEQVSWALRSLVALGFQIPAAKLASNAGQVGAQILVPLSKDEDATVRAAAQEAQRQNDAQARNVQEKLKALGFYDGPVDGTFNSRLRLAVQNFQREHGLDADGIVGPITYATIMATPLPNVGKQ